MAVTAETEDTLPRSRRWTKRVNRDPAATLLELFACPGQALAYCANRIPAGGDWEPATR